MLHRVAKSAGLFPRPHSTKRAGGSSGGHRCPRRDTTTININIKTFAKARMRTLPVIRIVHIILGVSTLALQNPTSFPQRRCTPPPTSAPHKTHHTAPVSRPSHKYTAYPAECLSPRQTTPFSVRSSPASFPFPPRQVETAYSAAQLCAPDSSAPESQTQGPADLQNAREAPWRRISGLPCASCCVLVRLCLFPASWAPRLWSSVFRRISCLQSLRGGAVGAASCLLRWARLLSGCWREIRPCRLSGLLQ